MARLGLANAALLTIVYVGRLTILNPKNPILLGAALLSGVIATPAWSLWVGRELRRVPAPVA